MDTSRIGEIVVTELAWERVPSPATAARLSPADRKSSLSEPIDQAIRVLLIDDHLSFRQPLAFMLMREPDITIIGQADTVAEARPLLPDADIALIDLELANGEGVVLLQELRSVNPQALPLVLTGTRSTEATVRAVEAGAAAVMHKSCSVSDVVDAIRRLKAGKPCCR